MMSMKDAKILHTKWGARGFGQTAVRLWRFFLLGMLCAGVLSWNASAVENRQIPCMVGYSIKTMPDVDSRDIEAAFRVWSQELAAQYGFYIEISLYDSADRLVADFLAQKIDFAAMTSIEFLRAAKILKVKPEVSQYRNGKSAVKFLVLADAGVKGKNPAGLKDKRLSILKNNALGTMFLDTYLMKAGLPSSEHFFSAVRERKKDSHVILDVFFGRSDVCVVTDSAFEAMKEMNPQVGRKLRVIAESSELTATIGVFRPGWPQEFKKKALEAMQSDAFQRHERGRQIMLLFNIEKLSAITDEKLESTRKLLADYDRLKAK